MVAQLLDPFHTVAADTGSSFKKLSCLTSAPEKLSASSGWQHGHAPSVLRRERRAAGGQPVPTGISRAAANFSPRDLGWDLPDEAVVEFLPCLGGFVGSDILAGIIAIGLHESRELTALMDLGTNGEVVVGNREKILCTSTAAGPAFEGARISQGMRAATGAISEVRVEDGFVSCRVIGGGEARGLCGSGLVDAVAAGLELDWIHPSGRWPTAANCG